MTDRTTGQPSRPVNAQLDGCSRRMRWTTGHRQEITGDSRPPDARVRAHEAAASVRQPYDDLGALAARRAQSRLSRALCTRHPRASPSISLTSRSISRRSSIALLSLVPGASRPGPSSPRARASRRRRSSDRGRDVDARGRGRRARDAPAARACPPLRLHEHGRDDRVAVASVGVLEESRAQRIARRSSRRKPRVAASHASSNSSPRRRATRSAAPACAMPADAGADPPAFATPCLSHRPRRDRRRRLVADVCACPSASGPRTRAVARG